MLLISKITLTVGLLGLLLFAWSLINYSPIIVQIFHFSLNFLLIIALYRSWDFFLSSRQTILLGFNLNANFSVTLSMMFLPPPFLSFLGRKKIISFLWIFVAFFSLYFDYHPWHFQQVSKFREYSPKYIVIFARF